MAKKSKKKRFSKISQRELDFKKLHYTKVGCASFAALAVIYFVIGFFNPFFAFFGAVFLGLSLLLAVIYHIKKRIIETKYPGKLKPKKFEQRPVAKKTQQPADRILVKPEPTIAQKVAKFTAVFLAILVVSGVVMYYVGQSSDSGTRDTSRLSTAISPARGISGTWYGTAVFQDNVANPNCLYQGRFKLDLKQSGNSVSGSLTLTITKSQKRLKTNMACHQPGTYPAIGLRGTVSSSQVSLSAGNLRLGGSFTSNIMKLNFESCPNQRCADGTYSTGWKGTTTLNK